MFSRFSFPSWPAFCVVAFALAIGTMGATLISPLYLLYQDAWSLKPSNVTHIYVIYMGGVLFSLLFLGRLSDWAGALPVLRVALGLLLAGTLLCAFAPNELALILARVLVGIASGLVTSSAAMGLSAAEPPGSGRKLAPLTTTMLTMAGFGMGPLFGGLVAQFSSKPLQWPFLLAGAVTLVGIVLLCWISTPRLMARKALSVTPRMMLPPAANRHSFVMGAAATFSVYAVFSLLASIAPAVLGRLLPWHGPAVTGLVLAVVLSCSALSQFPVRKLAGWVALRAGLALIAVSMVMLIFSEVMGWGVLFALGCVLFGCSHGISFMASMRLVNDSTPKEMRSGVLSSFFAIGYLGTIVPIIILGWMADAWGVSMAVSVFCAFFMISSLGMLLVSRMAAQARVRQVKLARSGIAP